MPDASNPSTTYDYCAVRVRQTADGPWIVLFAAPATEIHRWAGIPQKTAIGDSESLGFQRADDPARIATLAKFFKDERNVTPNPLLVAERANAVGNVTFSPDVRSDTGPHSRPLESGTLHISVDDLHSLSLFDLMRRARTGLEDRHPSLRELAPDPNLIRKLREELAREEPEEVPQPLPEEELDAEDDPSETPDLSAAVTTESHIVDFWNDLACRIHLLSELELAAQSAGDKTPTTREKFLRYTRSELLSYLTPVILVDGQHRLLGALESLRLSLDTFESTGSLPIDDPLTEKMLHLIEQGMQHQDVRGSLEAELVRFLPVSLLLSKEPQEHVFQFIVVNQKAKPIPPALLATITSTTLTDDELESVADRLERAGIGVHHARAIARVLADEDNPFYGRVDRGIRATNSKRSRHMLQHKVLGGLVDIFRNLKKGKLYGPTTTDWADGWHLEYLDESNIVSDCEDRGYTSRYEYWRELQWYVVFKRFWINIRDRFADTENIEADNYWGNPPTSNIFNMVSLTILTADFFRFLCNRETGIDSLDHLDKLMSDWLKRVNAKYFARKWDLRGLKKTNTGIQKQWAYQWITYRDNPRRDKRLPKAELYGKAFSG